jgi:hypothetical protein
MIHVTFLLSGHFSCIEFGSPGCGFSYVEESAEKSGSADSSTYEKAMVWKKELEITA